VPPLVHFTVIHRIAVGQQHRIPLTVRLDAGTVAGHDIRPVQEIGDATEAFGLALGTEHAGGFVEPLEPRIVLWADTGDHVQVELIGYITDSKRLGVHERAFNRAPIQDQGFKLQVFPQVTRSAFRAIGFRVTADLETGVNPGLVFEKLKTQIHMVDEKRRFAVILQVDTLRL